MARYRCEHDSPRKVLKRPAAVGPLGVLSRNCDSSPDADAKQAGVEQKVCCTGILMEMTCARLDSALAALIPRDYIHLGRKLVAIDRNESTVTLVFRVDAVLVVGADGIHSM